MTSFLQRLRTDYFAGEKHGPLPVLLLARTTAGQFVLLGAASSVTAVAGDPLRRSAARLLRSSC